MANVLSVKCRWTVQSTGSELSGTKCHLTNNWSTADQARGEQGKQGRAEQRRGEEVP